MFSVCPDTGWNRQGLPTHQDVMASDRRASEALETLENMAGALHGE